MARDDVDELELELDVEVELDVLQDDDEEEGGDDEEDEELLEELLDQELLDELDDGQLLDEEDEGGGLLDEEEDEEEEDEELEDMRCSWTNSATRVMKLVPHLGVVYKGRRDDVKLLISRMRADGTSSKNTTRGCRQRLRLHRRSS